ncbi:MAG: hypothetical protein N2487_04855 [Verrucomicrobiae bacterium]|nr:hypothetical protein [Verrucomicrobiae bacterium]
MLATLASLKERLGIPQYETGQDKILAHYLKMVSHRFERECDRFFARKENFCEEFPADYTEILVCRYPIETISGIELITDEQSCWHPITDAIYVIRNRCIVSLLKPPGDWRQRARLVYTGGFVLPGNPYTEGQTPLPEDIELACIEQTAYMYQNRERLGLVGFAGLRSDYQRLFNLNSSISDEQNQNVRLFMQFENIDLLPGVSAVLSRYKRII